MADDLHRTAPEAKAPGDIDVPKELRSIVEASLVQARQAVDSLLLVAHRALDDGEQRTDRLQEQAREASRNAMQLIEANVTAGFDFAAQLARARTLPEWVKLNQDFAARHAARLAEQARRQGEAVVAAAEPVVSAPVAAAPVPEPAAPIEPEAEPSVQAEPASEPVSSAAVAEVAPEEGLAEEGASEASAAADPATPAPAVAKPAARRGPRKNPTPPDTPA